MIVSITRISDSKTQQFSIRQNDPHHSRMVFTQLSQAAVAFGNKSDVLIRFGTGPCPTQKEIDRLLEKFQWHRMGCRALRNPIVDSKQLFLEDVYKRQHIHEASKTSTSTTVGKWSAGCQVVAEQTLSLIHISTKSCKKAHVSPANRCMRVDKSLRLPQIPTTLFLPAATML